MIKHLRCQYFIMLFPTEKSVLADLILKNTVSACKPSPNHIACKYALFWEQWRGWELCVSLGLCCYGHVWSHLGTSVLAFFFHQEYTFVMGCLVIPVYCTWLALRRGLGGLDYPPHGWSKAGKCAPETRSQPLMVISSPDWVRARLKESSQVVAGVGVKLSAAALLRCWCRASCRAAFAVMSIAYQTIGYEITLCSSTLVGSDFLKSSHIPGLRFNPFCLHVCFVTACSESFLN